MSYAEDKTKRNCDECGNERQCSHFNHEDLMRWQMKICHLCFIAWYRGNGE